jgi:hypothetical protein
MRAPRLAPRPVVADLVPVNGRIAENVRRGRGTAICAARAAFSLVFIDVEPSPGNGSMRKRAVVCN